MVVALPVPGFITKSLRHTQQEKMRRVRSFLPSSSLADCLLVAPRRTVAFNLSLRVSPSNSKFVHRLTITRVQVMNAIRMIKLFGWESKILQQLNEKRADELDSIRRARFLGVSNNICKYVCEAPMTPPSTVPHEPSEVISCLLP